MSFTAKRFRRRRRIFEFDKDRLVCEKVYFDMATLMNQLSTVTNK